MRSVADTDHSEEGGTGLVGHSLGEQGLPCSRRTVQDHL